MRSADDLTAVARIRDAAIDLVGQHGFSVGLRAIAKVSTIADFDEFMATHGDEAKALGGLPGTDGAERPATLS